MTASSVHERRIHTVGLVAIAAMCLFLCVAQTTSRSSSKGTRGHTSPRNSTTNTTTTSVSFLVTKLCADKCESDCRHYQTPFQQCYNGQSLFPNDTSWNSTVDILDTLVNENQFRREFFPQGQNCQREPTDGFELPFEACVGPFGAPRPWGCFQMLAMI